MVGPLPDKQGLEKKMEGGEEEEGGQPSREGERDRRGEGG